MYANTTLLGEDVCTREEAEQVVGAYERCSTGSPSAG